MVDSDSRVPDSQNYRNAQLRASKSNADRSGKIVYSDYAISRWFAVGVDDENNDTLAAHLKPVSVESIERRTGKKPLILVKNNLDQDAAKGCPWSSIAENVLPYLLSSFEKARAKIECRDSKDVKLEMVARFGKILLQGRSKQPCFSILVQELIFSLEGISKDCVSEAALTELKKSFYTSLPSSYSKNIIAEVASKIGVDFADMKDVYHVKLSDSTQPASTISCKCRVELNQVRDMVIDISCLDMNLDLRLMLTQENLNFYDYEMKSIQNLIDSAVLDRDVNGGLRWPSGKASSGNRYNVVGVWHTMTSAYENPSIRLKVRHADRFDFRTAYGEASEEVFLKLKGIVSGLVVSSTCCPFPDFVKRPEQDLETNGIFDLLKDNLSLIWEHFLSCEPFLA
ncbi:putative MYBputative [Hibiscus syriacus]|uniref:MYBputative n=1 Tax=Hibiscus syriacus TaxID=106335 RepID=A0A6A2YXM1_HIBSY|nr:putative MYBputative [Hibiscus syriacus]